MVVEGALPGLRELGRKQEEDLGGWRQVTTGVPCFWLILFETLLASVSSLFFPLKSHRITDLHYSQQLFV